MGRANQNPAEILTRGIEILNPTLSAHGFRYVAGGQGASSGGDFASGKYVRWRRTLELHVRYQLGLVTYRFGGNLMRHEVFMRAALGKEGGNKYPGFSDDPLDAFRDLRYDLENFGVAFLRGDRKAFQPCVEKAGAARKLSGIERIDQNWPSAIEEVPD